MRLVSKLSPNNLKVETRSTKPADVDRYGRLAVLREPKIISLVFDVLSRIELSQKSVAYHL